MRYLSLIPDSTQDSAPIACQCLLCADRQPPHVMDETPCQEDFFPVLPCLRPERPEPLEADEKGALPLRPFRFPPCWVEEEEAVFCDRSTMGEAPPWSAEEADVKLARISPAKDFWGIFRGCKVLWTRASFDAACILSRAKSSKAEGKRPADEGSAA